MYLSKGGFLKLRHPGGANSWGLCADNTPSSCSHESYIAVATVHHTRHEFAYLLVTSKQRGDRE